MVTMNRVLPFDSPAAVEDARPHGLALRGRRVLLATDGLPSSDAATRVAYDLAREHGALVEMLHVVDTRPAPIPPPLDVMLAAADDASRARTHDDQVRALRWRVGHVVDAPIDWDARILLGTPARTIVREAERTDAALIVMGLRRYGKMDRIVNDETTIATVRAASCPVLAVASDNEGLPTRILSAMDFSEPSVQAARVATSVMRGRGRMTMAYVPPLHGYDPDDGARLISELGISAAFERYAYELRSESCRVDHVVLHHEVRQSIAATLLDYADSIHAGMIAVGNVSHGLMERWLLGSVSQDLLRDGRHTILVAPSRAFAGAKA